MFNESSIVSFWMQLIILFQLFSPKQLINSFTKTNYVLKKCTKQKAIKWNRMINWTNKKKTRKLLIIVILWTDQYRNCEENYLIKSWKSCCKLNKNTFSLSIKYQLVDLFSYICRIMCQIYIQWVIWVSKEQKSL